MTVSRFLALVLAFFLGFLSCIGAIFGVGYFAYSRVSLDQLEKWGVVSVDEGQYVDEDAEVDLTAMTIKAFISEIKELRDLDKTVSIDLLIERWGLKIPDEIMQKIPTGVRTLSVKEIFSKSGISAILENTDVSYLFQFLPADVLAEPAREALTGKTLKEVVELKMTDLLTGIKLGYIAGVQYEKDSSGRYLPVYKDPAKPTLLELLGSLDLGKTLDVVGNGGDMLAVINDGMNDVMIDLLIKSVSSDDNATLNGIVAGKTIGDLIVEDETTGALSLDVGVLINGRKFGDLMGYTPVYYNNDESTGIIVDWLDGEGARVKGVMRALADGTIAGLGEDAGLDTDALLSNSYIGFFQEYDPIFDASGNITGWLNGDGNPPDRLLRTLANKKLTDMIGDGFSLDNLIAGLYVGDLMSYTPVEDGEGNIVDWKDGNGEDLDRVTAALAKQKVEDLTSGNFEIDDALEGLYVGDLMKYTSVKDGEGNIIGWKDANGEDLDRVSESLAKKPITDLTSGDFEVGDALEGLYVGDLLKYTPVKDDPDDPDKVTGWLDKDNKPVTGLDRATANIDLKRLIDDDTYKVADAFDEVYLGEAMGYYRDADPLPKVDPLDETEALRYQWYKTKDTVSGDLSNPTAGIEQKLANYFLGDLIDGKITSDKLTEGMPLHELLNLHAVDTPLYDNAGDPMLYTTGDHAGEQATVKIWYDKNNVRQSDTISSLAYCTIDGISEQVNAVKVGGVTGLTLFEDNWYKAEFRSFGVDDERYCLSAASGVLPSLADLSIGDLSNNDLVTDKIKAVRIGDAMGYTFSGGVWYTDSTLATPVSGMMKALAPKTVGNMETIGDDMPIGELLGYTKVGGVWYETYVDVGDPGNVKASGIMASIADFHINGLGDSVQTIRIGSILELYRYETDDPLDPNYGTWYKDEARTVPADGIMAKFAELTVEDMKDSSKVTAKTKTILIGDAMGYVYDGGVWYTDDTLATPVTGMMKALAPKTVGEMDTVSTTVPVGELLGYEKVGDIWYSTYVGPADPGNVEASGVIGAICDSYVDTLSNDIEEMQLGKVLSLYKYNNELDPLDPKNGKWFKDRAYTEEATGVMVSFADMKIKDLSDETKVSAKSVNVVIGYAMGYAYDGGVWYTDSTLATPVTGVMKSLAPKTVGELNDITHTMTVGEMMGYEKVGGVWYSTYVGPDDPGNVRATGVIQAVADSTIDNLESDLNDTKVGKILGYTYNEGEHWWYDGLTKTSTIINTISDTELDQLGTRMSNLTVADMFSDAERASGFLSLLPADARLDELGGSGPNSMSSIFTNTKMGDYISKGLITFTPATEAKLDLAFGADPNTGWRGKTIQQFLDSIMTFVP